MARQASSRSAMRMAAPGADRLRPPTRKPPRSCANRHDLEQKAASIFAVGWVLRCGARLSLELRDAAHIVYDWVNVLEWQFLFVVGLAAAHLRASGRARVALSSWLPALAFVAVTLFAVLHMPAVRLSILGAQPIYWLMDKRDLGLLRLLNFLVAAYLVASLLKPDSRMLRWRALAPIVGCGQHSLPIFCLGLMLSALGGYLLLTIDNGAIMQTLVSLGGIATLIGALLLLEKRAPVPFRRKMPLPLSSAPV